MESQSTFKQIKKLYKGLSYFDSYGSDVILSLFIAIIFFGLISWYHVLNNLEPIKNDWVNQRCRPNIMPFAAMINPPNDGRSNSQFTADNFTGCTQNIIKDIVGHITKPVEYTLSIITKFFTMLLKVLDKIRTMLTKIRGQLKAFGKKIMARIMNITIGIQEFFIHMREMINKIQGIFIAGFYVVLGSYYTLKSTIGALFEIIVIILFILLGVIIPLWMLPFTWGFAAAMTAIFVAIAIPLTIVAVAMNSAMGTTLSGIPSTPGCFEENTIVLMNNGRKKKMKDIVVGDILINNNIVTSKMIMSSKYETLYNLDNTYVTGSHKVYYKNNIVYVKNHPDAIVTCNGRFRLVCLNVSNKCININNTNFCDYDEMNDDETTDLYNHVRANIICNRNTSSNNFIHRFYHGGFSRRAKIQLSNFTFKNIENIQKDDMLEGENRVLGCVEILNKNLHHGMLRIVNNNSSYYVSENLNINHLGKLCKISTQIDDTSVINNIPKNMKVYHLITTRGFFKVGDITFKDYNALVESYIS